MQQPYVRRFRMEAERLPATPPSPLPAGYVAFPWSAAAAEPHAAATFLAFCGEPDAGIFQCFASLDGCRGLIRDLSSNPEFLPTATWLFMTAEGQPCGTVQATVRGPAGIIENVGVTPPHRGKGLGACLIERALAAFVSAGLVSAALDVTADNHRAIQLYQRLGFRRTAVLAVR